MTQHVTVATTQGRSPSTDTTVDQHVSIGPDRQIHRIRAGRRLLGAVLGVAALAAVVTIGARDSGTAPTSPPPTDMRAVQVPTPETSVGGQVVAAADGVADAYTSALD